MLISLPHPDYLSQVPHWRFIEDVYEGDSAWIEYREDGSAKPRKNAQTYLPKLSGENDPHYQARLLSSHYSDKFARAVRDFVGIIFSNGLTLTGLPDRLLEFWSTLGGDGVNGDRLCAFMAMRALRLGHCFCLVDFPTRDPGVVSHADAIAANRAPYWNMIHPTRVINWSWVQRGRQRHLASVVITHTEQVLTEKGYVEKDFYCRYQPGIYQTFSLKRDNHGNVTEVYHPDKSGLMGQWSRGRFTPFDEIPLVFLGGGDRTAFFKSNPTLLAMARLNVHHYQVKSDHRYKMHKCSFPTPFRVGGDGSNMVIGPGTIVDVPLGGAFGWSEPNSMSLQQSRQEVQDIEAELDILGADFLSKPGDRQAAQTSLIQAAKVESELYLFASDFADGLNAALDWHAKYLGLKSGGKATLNTEFFSEMSADPQLLQALIQMRTNNDLEREELRDIANRKFSLFEETINQ